MSAPAADEREQYTVDEVYVRFQEARADELGVNSLGITGWVPAEEVDELASDIPTVWIQYWTDDGVEAFVAWDKPDPEADR